MLIPFGCLFQADRNRKRLLSHQILREIMKQISRSVLYIITSYKARETDSLVIIFARAYNFYIYGSRLQ